MYYFFRTIRIISSFKFLYFLRQSHPKFHLAYYLLVIRSLSESSEVSSGLIVCESHPKFLYSLPQMEGNTDIKEAVFSYPTRPTVKVHNHEEMVIRCDKLRKNDPVGQLLKNDLLQQFAN